MPTDEELAATSAVENVVPGRRPLTSIFNTLAAKANAIGRIVTTGRLSEPNLAGTIGSVIASDRTVVRKTSVLAPWTAVLRESPALAKIALVGPSTVDIAAAGVARHGRWKFHITPGGYLEGMVDANILNFGFNGASPDGITSPTNMANLAASGAHLVMVSGLLINYERNVNHTVEELVVELAESIERIRAALPGVPVVIEPGSIFLTTDVGGNGYVVPNGDAAAKAERIRLAHLAVIDRWPDVLVVDTQTDVYGPGPFATHPFMGDQIHMNAAGANAEVDNVVPLVGIMRPLAPGRVRIARTNSPYTPWVDYGREVEDPTRYVLVASGGFSNMGGTGGGSYLDFGYSYAARGNLQRGDIVELPDGTSFVYEANISLGTPGADGLRMSGSGIPARPSSLVNSRGVVRVWRRTAAADAAVHAVLVDESWRFKRIGFVAVAPNGTTLDIRAGSAGAKVATQPASEWALEAGDRVYIDGLGATYFTIGTDATAITSGSNLRLSALASADRSALLYRMAVVVGTHADAAAGAPGEPGPAGGIGSLPTSGRDILPLVFGGLSASAGTNGNEYAVPIIPLADGTISALSVEVSTAVAGATIRLGIRSASGYLPGAVLQDLGTVDCSTTGMKTLAATQAVTAGTHYWLVASLAGSAAANVKTMTGVCPFITYRGGVASEVGASSFYAVRSTVDAALPGGGPSLPGSWAPLIRATIA